MSWCIILFDVMLHYPISRRAIPCYVILSNVIPFKLDDVILRHEIRSYEMLFDIFQVQHFVCCYYVVLLNYNYYFLYQLLSLHMQIQNILLSVYPIFVYSIQE